MSKPDLLFSACVFIYFFLHDLSKFERILGNQVSLVTCYILFLPSWLYLKVKCFYNGVGNVLKMNGAPIPAIYNFGKLILGPTYSSIFFNLETFGVNLFFWGLMVFKWMPYD